MSDNNDGLYLIEKTYPKKYLGSIGIDKTVVRFDIHTLKPLPDEFEKELMDLIDKYCKLDLK